jgi:hypothetical protein
VFASECADVASDATNSCKIKRAKQCNNARLKVGTTPLGEAHAWMTCCWNYKYQKGPARGATAERGRGAAGPGERQA